MRDPTYRRRLFEEKSDEEYVNDAWGKVNHSDTLH